ncbi:MAG TPA: MOSC domain-containing protein [Acidimicrobiales bacterium]|nr:MOSC domain-containing protein [Acidimicrobiales bacterium]
MVTALFVAPGAGAPMRGLDRARLLPGRGLEGDRYAAGTGTWSADRALWSDVTLVASEALAVVAAGLAADLAPGWSRRNVVTTGVDLDGLIGRRFRIGDALLWGERPCHPCAHLDRMSGVPLRPALRGRGGLRAGVLAGGELAVGHPVVPDPR